jgi:hypothetical protein
MDGSVRLNSVSETEFSLPQLTASMGNQAQGVLVFSTQECYKTYKHLATMGAILGVNPVVLQKGWTQGSHLFCTPGCHPHGGLVKRQQVVVEMMHTSY